jgi:acyl-CoA synthetase (AMP-forming)/AMP-acid ligase II
MISERLRRVALRNRDALAIVDGGQRISYGELLQRVQAAREWLRKALDPKPGDVIAASLDNS